MSRARAGTPSALAFAVLTALVTTSCSGSSTPHLTPPSTPATATPSPGGATSSDPQFAAELTAELQPPALPSFAIPTDLLDSAQDRDIAHQLNLQPGLYQGIAVLSERCAKNGTGHSADAGASSTAGNGSYKKGDVEVTVKRDGTGVYNAPGIHVAVLPGGAGVYQHGGQRLSVEPDGSGTWAAGAVRLTVKADGSGSYANADSRFWVGPDSSGGYDGAGVRISVSSSGAVTGNASAGQQAVVKQLVAARLSRFPAVPAVRRVKPTGTVCGTVIRLDANALFDFGSADLRPDAHTLIDRVAALLTVLKPRTIHVNGYTDHLGGPAANLRLSQLRAGHVAAELSAHGVPAGSTVVRGFGEADPLGPETTRSGADNPAARQLDRRVEIVLPN